jgi:hypothetical protein
MESNNELQRLELEIQKLELEKKRLELIRDAKIEALKMKFMQYPAQFQAAHPFVSGALGTLGKGALETAKTAGTGLKALVEYLADEQRKEELHRRRLGKEVEVE